MRGRSDDEYTMIAALFARRLLTENKRREDANQIRTCIVLEEAHNILSDAELSKGTGSGSVFIELAREGRSFKLGFVLVTQQPDARSIAPRL
jgi:DNA helicase HerA-like ATPase